MKRKMLIALLAAVMALGVAGVSNAALYTQVANLDALLFNGGTKAWSFDTPTDFNVPPYDYTANIFIRGYFVDKNSNTVAVNSNIVGNLATGSIFTLFASNTNINIGNVFINGWAGGTSFNVAVNANETLYLDYSKFALTYTPSTGGAAPVPEPGTMLLLGTGLVGLAAYGRKRFRK